MKIHPHVVANLYGLLSLRRKMLRTDSLSHQSLLLYDKKMKVNDD